MYDIVERLRSDSYGQICWSAADEIEALRAEVNRCHARLEIDHAWLAGHEDDNGVIGEIRRIEVPLVDRHTMPDGIECRDETIKLLENDLEALRARVKALGRKVIGE